MWSVATKLQCHACVKRTIPARLASTFCRTVAEHDLVSSPGSGDEARLSLSLNWMQTSLPAPTAQLLIAVLHTEQELGITTLLQYKCQCSEDVCLLEIKIVAAKKEINQHSLCSSGFEQSILV